MHRRAFITGVGAALAASSRVDALTPGQRLVLLGGASIISSSSLFHSAFSTMDLPASAGIFTSPGRIRPVEPLRTQFIIRNVGSTNIDLGPQTDNSNFAGPTSWTISALAPGQEYVDNGASTSAWFVRPHTSGQGGTYTTYFELNGTRQSGIATTRALTAPAIGIPALNVLSYAAATAYPCGLSTDRHTIYGTAATGTLFQSTNGGGGWAIVNSTAFAASGNVVGLVETDDGEALCYVQGGSAAPGFLFKSSGWTASHSAATWTLVKTSASNAYFQGIWNNSFSFGKDTINASGKYGVLTEYGPLLNAGLDATFPTHVYLTKDYGLTWALILDIQVTPPSSYPMHTKCAVIDPYWMRVWVNYDLTNDGTNISCLYADIDANGNLGAWTKQPLPTEWQGIAAPWQANSIAPMENCLIFSGDHTNGFYRIPRKSYRQTGTLEVSSVTAMYPGSLQTAMETFRSAPGQRMFASLIAQTGNNEVPGLIYTDDATGGASLIELWRDNAYVNSVAGAVRVNGPSAGYFLAQIAPAAGGALTLRGKVIDGVVGQFPQYLYVTGDGATTVFNFPHFLSFTPTRLNVYPQNVAAVGVATPTMTADGTNLILTFAVAPVNTTVYRYAARYGSGSNPAPPAMSITFGAEAENTTSQTSYTFNAVPIGAQNDSRRTVIAIAIRTANTLSRPTVTMDPGDGGGAQTCTLVTDQFTGVGSPVTYSGLWQVPGVVPLGTTATIVVSGLGAAAARCAIETYSVVTTQDAISA